MDNLTHTLTGAALGAAGLNRRTALAMPALLLGANAPDIDAFAYFIDPVLALDFRRGWTHGVLAMLLLPFVLTALMLGAERIAMAVGRPPAERAKPRALLLVSAIAILSHPLLDLMNTYGVRLLTPFSWTWFYADTWFIVDPWVLAVLIIGLVLAWKAHSTFPARAALGALAGYAILMASLGATATAWVRDGAPSLLGATPGRVLASPEFGNPLVRRMLVETDSFYYSGRVRFLPPRVSLYRDPVARNRHLAPLAARYDQGRMFLGWSRFPIFSEADGLLMISDARYGGPRTGWARIEIPVNGRAGDVITSR